MLRANIIAVLRRWVMLLVQHPDALQRACQQLLQDPSDAPAAALAPAVAALLGMDSSGPQAPSLLRPHLRLPVAPQPASRLAPSAALSARAAPTRTRCTALLCTATPPGCAHAICAGAAPLSAGCSCAAVTACASSIKHVCTGTPPNVGHNADLAHHHVSNNMPQCLQVPEGLRGAGGAWQRRLWRRCGCAQPHRRPQVRGEEDRAEPPGAGGAAARARRGGDAEWPPACPHRAPLAARHVGAVVELCCSGLACGGCSAVASCRCVVRLRRLMPAQNALRRLSVLCQLCRELTG